MPALDRYHSQVRNALIKDGWSITDDPLTLHRRQRKLFNGTHRRITKRYCKGVSILGRVPKLDFQI